MLLVEFTRHMKELSMETCLIPFYILVHELIHYDVRM